MANKPYRHYSREQIFELLKHNCNESGMQDYVYKCKVAAFDPRWDPSQYDGCTGVGDPLHPFPPCFIHDWEWTVNGGGKQSDRNFLKDCMKFGLISKKKARRWYLGIRIAWIFYYKWLKMLS